MVKVKLKKQYTKFAVVGAMVHGMIIGISAIAVAAVFLYSVDKKETIPKEDVPVSGPVAKEPAVEKDMIPLYAKQYGVFSNASAAATFLSSEPSLSTAAILNVEQQYYVWSAVKIEREQAQEKEEPISFVKPIFVQVLQCEEVPDGMLRQLLLANDVTEIKKMGEQQKDKNAQAFYENLSTAMAFSSDMSVIRLHMLSHYIHRNDCINIEF